MQCMITTEPSHICNKSIDGLTSVLMNLCTELVKCKQTIKVKREPKRITVAELLEKVIE